MSRFIRSISRAFLVLALTLGMAWASEASARAAARGNQAPRDQANYEAWLTREVRHQLVMLPYLTLFDNLEYKVDGTAVTLLGQVVDPSLKPDAANVVKHIEGVTKVVNNIEVLPPSPMDAQIRRAEYRAIYGYADLWRYAMGALPPVHIVVDMGHVTLYGVVDSQSDKNLIELRAKTVPSVFSVTDNLEVANQGGK
ncbi:MAG TPA: BON domain-containing protein [Candidatus Cybelea sp.]|nr:BON domain-containing protein [Candidatus Cybelea sp.]